MIPATRQAKNSLDLGCPFRDNCAFFTLCQAQPGEDLRMALERYCLAPQGYRQCWRLTYRQDTGSSPPPCLAPSGESYTTIA